MQRPNHRRAGFTLVEIMIVVAIISLLAAIVVPGHLRARKRSQATLIMKQLKLLDDAVAQYAIDNSKTDRDTCDWTDLVKYVKPGTLLYDSCGANDARDILGNPFPSVPEIGGVPPSGNRIFVSPISYNALSDVTPNDFWSPFEVGGG
jgi:prepilin-type N-terminal cleavage/methylation domain-containing protein